jgi:hypothetical protein
MGGANETAATHGRRGSPICFSSFSQKVLLLLLLLPGEMAGWLAVSRQTKN